MGRGAAAAAHGSMPTFCASTPHPDCGAPAGERSRGPGQRSDSGSPTPVRRNGRHRWCPTSRSRFRRHSEEPRAMSDGEPNQMHLRPQGQAGSALLPVMLLMFCFPPSPSAWSSSSGSRYRWRSGSDRPRRRSTRLTPPLRWRFRSCGRWSDWTPVLTGAVQSARSDGIFAGRKNLPGGGSVVICCGSSSVAGRLAGNPRWPPPSPGGHWHGGPSSGLRWRRFFPARRWAASMSWCSWRMTRMKRMGMGRQMRTGGWS